MEERLAHNIRLADKCRDCAEVGYQGVTASELTELVRSDPSIASYAVRTEQREFRCVARVTQAVVDHEPLWIANFTDLPVPQGLSTLLRRGQKYGVSKESPDHVTLLAAIAKAEMSIGRARRHDEISEDEVAATRAAVASYLTAWTGVTENLLSVERDAIGALRKSGIVALQADKGGTWCLFYMSDYVKYFNLFVRSTYPAGTPPLDGESVRCLKELSDEFDRVKAPQWWRQFVRQGGAWAARLRGLPKIHKLSETDFCRATATPTRHLVETIAWRPVADSTTSPVYKLSSTMNKLLQYLCSKIKSDHPGVRPVKGRDEFVALLREVIPAWPDGAVMLKTDIKEMFVKTPAKIVVTNASIAADKMRRKDLSMTLSMGEDSVPDGTFVKRVLEHCLRQKMVAWAPSDGNKRSIEWFETVCDFPIGLSLSESGCDMYVRMLECAVARVLGGSIILWARRADDTCIVLRSEEDAPKLLCTLNRSTLLPRGARGAARVARSVGSRAAGTGVDGSVLRETHRVAVNVVRVSLRHTEVDVDVHICAEGVACGPAFTEVRFEREHGDVDLRVPGSTLPFLDVEMSVVNGKLVTNVYRKGCDRGLKTNGDANAPQRYIDAMVFAHCLRAIRVVENPALLRCELARIRAIAAANKLDPSTVDGAVAVIRRRDAAKVEMESITSAKRLWTCMRDSVSGVPGVTMMLSIHAGPGGAHLRDPSDGKFLCSVPLVALRCADGGTEVPQPWLSDPPRAEWVHICEDSKTVDAVAVPARILVPTISDSARRELRMAMPSGVTVTEWVPAKLRGLLPSVAVPVPVERQTGCYLYACTCGSAYVGMTVASIAQRNAQHASAVWNGKETRSALALHIHKVLPVAKRSEHVWHGPTVLFRTNNVAEARIVEALLARAVPPSQSANAEYDADGSTHECRHVAKVAMLWQAAVARHLSSWMVRMIDLTRSDSKFIRPADREARVYTVPSAARPPPPPPHEVVDEDEMMRSPSTGRCAPPGRRNATLGTRARAAEEMMTLGDAGAMVVNGDVDGDEPSPSPRRPGVTMSQAKVVEGLGVAVGSYWVIGARAFAARYDWRADHYCRIPVFVESRTRVDDPGVDKRLRPFGATVRCLRVATRPAPIYYGVTLDDRGVRRNGFEAAFRRFLSEVPTGETVGVIVDGTHVPGVRPWTHDVDFVLRAGRCGGRTVCLFPRATWAAAMQNLSRSERDRVVALSGMPQHLDPVLVW
jgi:hypothetical protein